MQTVNIHEAKTHLSRLVDQAAAGEPFVIAKAGKPLVKVVPLNAPEGAQVKRLGFLSGQISVPDDFNEMGTTETDQTVPSLFECSQEVTDPLIPAEFESLPEPPSSPNVNRTGIAAIGPLGRCTR